MQFQQGLPADQHFAQRDHDFSTGSLLTLKNSETQSVKNWKT